MTRRAHLRFLLLCLACFQRLPKLLVDDERLHTLGLRA
jgi:hypothetical protein